MVMDKHGRSHKPQGLPQGVAGTYDSQQGVGIDDDLTAIPTLKSGNSGERKRVYRHLDETMPGWHMMESLLKATERGKKDDYRDEPLVTEEETQEILERETHKLAKSIRNTWVKHGVTALGERPEDIARTMLLERLYALRRSCASDPTKGYTARLVNYVLSRPLRMESILAKPPYSVPAHQQRVGNRYQKALKAWYNAHPGARATNDIKDQIWDETIDAYCREKEAKGVKYGRGMTRSDGTSARSDVTKLHTRFGRPVNGRIEFEEASSRAWEQIGNNPYEFGDVAMMADTSTKNPEIDIKKAYEMAKARFGEAEAQKVLAYI